MNVPLFVASLRTRRTDNSPRHAVLAEGQLRFSDEKDQQVGNGGESGVQKAGDGRLPDLDSFVTVSIGRST